MKYITFSLLALFIVFSSVALAGQKVNFSGQWILNKDASNMPQGRRGFGVPIEIKITQTEDTLVVERTIARKSGETKTLTEKYTLDGKECENKTIRGVKKSTVTWSEDGKALIIESTREFSGRKNRSFTVHSTEKWTLSKDGKQLIMDNKFETPRGERTFKIVYDKKE